MGNKLFKPYPLPSKYKAQKILGEGGFGVVLKCLDQDTKKIVAIKYAKHSEYLGNEASKLHVLMDNNLDQQNIVKFHTGFWMNKCLVFENLDISLHDYFCKKQGPMRLQDMRSVIQQLATAFDALKTVGVIHTDLKTDNIMLVDHVRQPFKVKLIDFGLAVFKSEAKTVTIHQTPFFRAPEVIFSHPFSEAVDIWSLGCVMGKMVLGHMIFPGRDNHQLLQYMIELLGLAPNHVINAGWKSKHYFRKFKRPVKYWDIVTDNRLYPFRSLDEMKMVRLEEKKNATEADERRECIELLKAMLTWDERERITPSGILNHPFITKSYLNCSSHLSSCNETDTNQAADPSMSSFIKPGINNAANSNTEEAAEPGTDQETQPDVNQAAHSGTRQAHSRNKETLMRTNVDDKTRETYSLTSTVLPSGIIMVQPAPPECRRSLEETSDKKSISLSLSSASMAEDTNAKKHPEDTDDRESKKTNVDDKTRETYSLTSTVLPSGIIMVQPAPPECRRSLEETSDKKSTSLRLSSASVAEDTNAKKHPEDTDDRESKKKKKRKNCFNRFLSWVRRRSGKVGNLEM